MGRSRRATSEALRGSGLVVLAVVTVVLCYLALTRDPYPTRASAGDPGPPSATTDPVGPSESPASQTPAAETAAPPSVPDTTRADFSASDRLPSGARTYDNPATGTRLAVRDGLLTHGRPRGRLAIGTLETRLGADVQKLGARIRFPAEKPGSVALVAWTDSLVDARRAGDPVPTSGLRLVVGVDGWQLGVFDQVERPIAEGSYTPTSALATFQVFREGDRAWVVDPAGKVTQVEDPRIATMAGPWASWQVLEDTPDLTPAGIEELWAG